MTFSRGVMFSFTGLNLPADGSVYIQICPDTVHRKGLIKLSLMATGRPSGVLPMPGCPGRIQAMEWRTGGRGVGDLRSGRWWQDRGGGLGANRTVGEFAGAPVAGSGRDGGYSLVNVRRLGSGRPVGGGRDGRTPGRVRGAPAQGRMGQGGACSWMDGFVRWR